MMHYGCSGNPFNENKKILNVHRHSEINLTQCEGFDHYQKNISPFDYTRIIPTMKEVGDTDKSNAKENTMTKITRNKFQMSNTTFTKPLVKMQKDIHNLKYQLDTLLKKQKEITQIISKGTSKQKYEKLTKEQTKIEQERKLLITEYKQLLSEELKVPEPKVGRRVLNNKKSAILTKKSLIEDNEKKLEKVLDLRKVDVFNKK